MLSWPKSFPVYKQVPKSTCTQPCGTRKPGRASQGREVLSVKIIYSDASLGYWKKRMPFGNRADTDLNVIWHESELTSNWSFIVREFGESYYEGKANDDT